MTITDIIQLPKHLANLIAAGEVVERPASVVKELCENSFDAGARAVTVEIRAGGMTFIKITDDGSGIRNGDVPTAFLRHATSKLRDETGLEAIGTLGFRGEALAAVASVSEVEIVTRHRDEDEGTRAVLDCGEITALEPCGRAVGTTITVRDLFRNTPARQKFMKSDRSESSAVAQTVIRLALSHPDVALTYVRDGERELDTPGDGKLDAAIYAALGRDFLKTLIPTRYEGDGVSARGFVSSVEGLRGNRNFQFFILNGRVIKSRALTAALEQAYRNRMFTGKYPACVLWLETHYSRVDVNVHPAKTEVRFLYEKSAFDAVYAAAKNATDGAQITVERANAPLPEPNTDPMRPPAPKYEREPKYTPTAAANVTKLYGSGANFTSRAPAFPERSAVTEVHDSGKSAYNAEPQLSIVNYQLSTAKLIGEFGDKYIISEQGDTLLIIDKHAAHERVHFDRLKSQDYEPMPQTLIAPVVISLGDDNDALLDNAELLQTLGFSVESYGANDLAVREIPASIDASDAESALSEIAEQLRLSSREPSRAHDEILASVACKAAIKSGKSSEPRELAALVERVASGEIQTCPHGRPVAYRITKAALDKAFLRI
ncbi:MAG: DNA mismatch repair endonuclease MutL [Oscillospiraceae bacterium]|jgi:DNA mismatch repair protein MutL|nr:DNA mismatch repair endonuclease MutL [Oscillospiraceae bacterium]